MAKKGYTLVEAFKERDITPKPDDPAPIIYERIDYALRDDMKIVQKRTVRFAPDDYDKKGRLHNWGWKRWGRAKTEQGFIDVLIKNSFTVTKPTGVATGSCKRTGQTAYQRRLAMRRGQSASRKSQPNVIYVAVEDGDVVGKDQVPTKMITVQAEGYPATVGSAWGEKTDFVMGDAEEVMRVARQVVKEVKESNPDRKVVLVKGGASFGISKASRKSQDGVKMRERLEKELRILQRDLNSPRLSTYREGDTSEEEMARQRERKSKLNRFNEVRATLSGMDNPHLHGGRRMSQTRVTDGDVWKVRGQGRPVKMVLETFNGDLYFIVEGPFKNGNMFCFARLRSMPDMAEWGHNNINYLKSRDAYGPNKIWEVPRRDWPNINSYEHGLLVKVN